MFVPGHFTTEAQRHGGSIYARSAENLISSLCLCGETSSIPLTEVRRHDFIAPNKQGTWLDAGAAAHGPALCRKGGRSSPRQLHRGDLPPVRPRRRNRRPATARASVAQRV